MNQWLNQCALTGRFKSALGQLYARPDGAELFPTKEAAAAAVGGSPDFKQGRYDAARYWPSVAGKRR